MFELNKYEKQVETNISICFILLLMSDWGTAVAWIGLTACATLFGQLVYYPFRCKKKDEYLFVPWWILYLLYWSIFTYWTVHNLVAASRKRKANRLSA